MKAAYISYFLHAFPPVFNGAKLAHRRIAVKSIKYMLLRFNRKHGIVAYLLFNKWSTKFSRVVHVFLVCDWQVSLTRIKRAPGLAHGLRKIAGHPVTCTSFNSCYSLLVSWRGLIK